MDRRGVLLITGISAAGKTTVAELVAGRLDRAVHLRGDVFRRMVVSGRQDMVPASSADALEQLWLRHKISAMVADEYASAGFTVVMQDVVIGRYLSRMLEVIVSRPLAVAVLCPGQDAVAMRETERSKTAYAGGGFDIATLDCIFRDETPRIGVWIDSSDQTPEETAEEVLDRAWTEGLVA